MRPTRIRVENMREKKKKERKFGWVQMYPIPLKKASRIVLSLAIAALPLAGCDKTKDDNGTKPTPTPKKHNVELRFDGRTDAGCVNVAMDTIRKYNADPTVDSILMIADPYFQFETWDTQAMNNAVNYLTQRRDVNPNKVFGKGPLKLDRSVVEAGPDIVAALQNMGFTVITHYINQ